MEPLDEPLAREVGAALARGGTRDVPDACLVVSAARRRDTVVTSDRGDVQRLLDALGLRLQIIDI